MSRSPKRTWFQILGYEDAATLVKAFIVAGVLTADNIGIDASLTSVRQRLRQLLSFRRRSAVAWDYPTSIAANQHLQFTAEQLAGLYDETTKSRNSLVGDELWASALRLEVPIVFGDRTKVAGDYEITPEDVYASVGIVEEGIVQVPPVSISFATQDKKAGLRFDWPLRVGSELSVFLEEGWATRSGLSEVLESRSPTSMDLLIADQIADIPNVITNSIKALANNDYTDSIRSSLEEFFGRGPLVVAGVQSDQMAPWLDELTQSLSRDRPFDVAVFEAWDSSKRRGIASSTPPILLGWHGAFDRARVSNLITPTIRSLQSQASARLSIPDEVADWLAVPSIVSASSLAASLETMDFSGGQTGKVGHALSVIRPQIPTNIRTKKPKSEHSKVPEESPAKRYINAWIENATPPLEMDHQYSLGLKIGRLEAAALASKELGPIDSPGRDSTEILVVVSGAGFVAKPHQQKLVLPRGEDSQAIFFDMTPNSGEMLIRISLYSALELFLLEEFEVPVEVRADSKAA